MKLGYLFVPPHLRRANQIGGAEQGRATVARALGYTEFFAFAENGSADGRSFCGSEGAGFPKQQGPVDQTPPPQLASTGGTARADVVNRGEPIRFLRPDPAANATSEQEPFSPVWADTEALSRQWVAHVTGQDPCRAAHPPLRVACRAHRSDLRECCCGA